MMGVGPGGAGLGLGSRPRDKAPLHKSRGLVSRFITMETIYAYMDARNKINQLTRGRINPTAWVRVGSGNMEAVWRKKNRSAARLTPRLKPFSAVFGFFQSCSFVIVFIVLGTVVVLWYIVETPGNSRFHGWHVPRCSAFACSFCSRLRRHLPRVCIRCTGSARNMPETQRGSERSAEVPPPSPLPTSSPAGGRM